MPLSASAASRVVTPLMRAMSAFGVDAKALDLDMAALLILERAVAGDGGGLLGVGAEAHLALQSLRCADLAEQQAIARLGGVPFGCRLGSA